MEICQKEYGIHSWVTETPLSCIFNIITTQMKGSTAFFEWQWLNTIWTCVHKVQYIAEHRLMVTNSKNLVFRLPFRNCKKYSRPYIQNRYLLNRTIIWCTAWHKFASKIMHRKLSVIVWLLMISQIERNVPNLYILLYRMLWVVSDILWIFKCRIWMQFNDL